ncbi:hypothetical protein SNEBB_005032 [Seison nebaliae]|nr:hypothetical protein SNEBB_005032 [Seison nebaliae]
MLENTSKVQLESTSELEQKSNTQSNYVLPENVKLQSEEVDGCTNSGLAIAFDILTLLHHQQSMGRMVRLSTGQNDKLEFSDPIDATMSNDSTLTNMTRIETGSGNDHDSNVSYCDFESEVRE